MDNSNIIASLEAKEKELLTDLKTVKDAIILFSKKLDASKEEPKKKITDTEINTELFKSSFGWNDKILFALGNLKVAIVKEICDEILKYEKVPEDQLIKRVTVTASALAKEGKIRIVGKIGRANKYALMQKA